MWKCNVIAAMHYFGMGYTQQWAEELTDAQATNNLAQQPSFVMHPL